MNRYQLAKLIDWAGTLDSRKRMQKVVFMLKAAGCEFKADFILHHYGPYSFDLAQLSDEMVQAKLLKEYTSDVGRGRTKYGYQLYKGTAEQLRQLEKEARSSEYAGNMEQFSELAKLLFQEDLWDLEVASTIVYFRQQNLDRSIASEKAFAFKKVNPHSAEARRMEMLADKVLPI